MVQATEKTATWSAANSATVTPGDTTAVGPTRALYIGSAGNLAVRMVDGSTPTFVVLAGMILPIQVDRVLSTGTTAGGIIALW